MLGTLAVERFHESFPFLCRLVNGAISEVGDLFAMAASPASVHEVCAMARVGGRSCISLGDRSGHRLIGNGARESAVADALELAVPSGGGKPYLGSNVRI